MKKIFENMKPYALAVLPVAVIIICAWQNPGQNQKDSQKVYVNQKDTIPGDLNKEDYDEFKMKDLDKAMKELDINMDKLDEQMKHLDVNIDKEIEESLAKVDFDKIGKEVEESVNAINWKELQKEIDNSMDQAQEEIKKIDFNKINDEMKELQEKFQSKEFKEQFNSEKLHKEIDDAMSKAKEGIEKAKEELREMKNFTDELAKDKLIDKKKGYTIEWKNGDLYINGKEQPKDVSDKYRKYYKKDGKIKMNGEETESF
jgi:hypothetical protein